MACLIYYKLWVWDCASGKERMGNGKRNRERIKFAFSKPIWIVLRNVVSVNWTLATFHGEFSHLRHPLPSIESNAITPSPATIRHDLRNGQSLSLARWSRNIRLKNCSVSPIERGRENERKGTEVRQMRRRRRQNETVLGKKVNYNSGPTEFNCPDNGRSFNHWTKNESPVIIETKRPLSISLYDGRDMKLTREACQLQFLPLPSTTLDTEGRMPSVAVLASRRSAAAKRDIIWCTQMGVWKNN